MNLPVDHAITAQDLAEVNNLLGEATNPVIPFAWKQLVVTSIKIQVEDQRLNEAGNPVGTRVKRSIFMPQYGLGDAVLSQSHFAVKHAYDYYQHTRNVQFLNPKKRGKLFGNSLLGTAASHWELITRDLIDGPVFQNTLAYFKTCLQEWVKGYLSRDSRQKHFTFMRTPGSLKMDQRLKTDVYAFWEALYLYNEMGDFLWINPAESVTKLSETELKKCFFHGQPKGWQEQFREAPNAPQPDDMPLEDLKEYFCIKEEHSIRSQQRNTIKQRAENLAKRQANGHEDDKSNHWKKKKTGQSHSDLPIFNLHDEDLCPVHETKGAKPHPWGECALNPKNKDCKDLDKYRPKSNKDKTPSVTEIHTAAEFSNLTLAGIVPDLTTTIGDGKPCELCGTHTIPTALIQLIYPNTANQIQFKEQFLATPCEVKTQFWELFYDQYSGSLPLMDTTTSG